MNDTVRSLVSSNIRSSRYAITLVPILSSLFLIVISVIGEKNDLYFSFPLVCSILVASSFSLIGIHNDIQSRWYSFVASYRNDRRGLLCSILITFYLDAAVSCVIAFLILLIFDPYMLDHTIPALTVTFIGVSLIFSAALMVYSSFGVLSGFIIAIPVSTVFGGIVLYLSVTRLLNIEPLILLITGAGIIAMHVLSARWILRLDL